MPKNQPGARRVDDRRVISDIIHVLKVGCRQFSVSGVISYHDFILALKGDVVLTPVMNNTKWDELRLEMYALTSPPAWSTLSTTGYNYGPDREWFYHFREGGYDDILHVDIHVETPGQRERVRSALRKVHVPGEETPEGFRVFGYLQGGQGADYI